MDQDKYRIAENKAREANTAALEVLGYMWDNILQVVDRANNGECQECGKEVGASYICSDCDCEVNTYALANLDPLSIEEDGRIILTFGGPNIWISADDQICGAWWGGTIRCYAPTAEHERAIEQIREEISELAAC